MKKQFLALMICAALVFAAGVSYAGQNDSVKEKPQTFAISTNAP